MANYRYLGATMASKSTPLHPDLKAAWGHLSYIAYRGSNQWTAACPWCGEGGHDRNTGDPDRFVMFGPEPGANARGWCRKCEKFAWADEHSDDRSSPSPEAIEAARKERERLAALELELTKSKLRAIQSSPMWKEWHEQMEAEQRRIWEKRGVIDYFQDYYSLGYRTDYTYYYDGQEWRTPALTIPHFDTGWELANIQYRLQDVAPGAGKYRQTPGLPAAMFRTEPEERLSGAVLIVEGAIKSIVLYQHLGRKPLGFELNIVGIPSKTPSGAMLDQFDDCDPIYVLLDPDAYTDNSISSVARKLGQERVLVAKTPVKPDDLIVEYGGNADDLKHYLKQAVRA